MTKKLIRVGLLTSDQAQEKWLRELCRAAKLVKVAWSLKSQEELLSPASPFHGSIDLLLTTLGRDGRAGLPKKVGTIPVVSGHPREISVNFWKVVLSLCQKRKATAKEKEALFRSALQFWERFLPRLCGEERLAGIGQMAQRISHDLRNPLTSITGFGQMLCSEELSPEERADCLRRIKVSSKRMLEILDEISLYVQSEKVSPNLNRVKVRELVDYTMAPLMEELKQKGINVVAQVNEALEVYGDLPRLSYALTNLLENARDAMPRGGTLSLSAHGHNDQVYISVADTGPGIEPTILSRVFEPLVSFGKSGRTGLGLAITKKIVEAHGGTIFAERSTGGATLAILLPAI